MEKVAALIGIGFVIVMVVAIIVLLVYGPMKMASLCSRQEEAKWAKLKKHDEEVKDVL